MGWNLDDHEDNQIVLMVDLAMTRCPQLVRRGDDDVVIVPIAEYERLGGKKPGFVEHLRSMPPCDDLDLTRDRSPMRPFDLGE